MTPGDWTEFLNGSQSNTLTAFSVLLTMLSRYMVIAYAVGANLTRSRGRLP